MFPVPIKSFTEEFTVRFSGPVMIFTRESVGYFLNPSFICALHVYRSFILVIIFSGRLCPIYVQETERTY